MRPPKAGLPSLLLLLLLLLLLAFERGGGRGVPRRCLSNQPQPNLCLLFPFSRFASSLKHARVKERHNKILEEYFNLYDEQRDSVKWANMFLPNATFRVADAPEAHGTTAIAKLAQSAYDLNVTTKHELLKVYHVSENLIIFEGVASNNVSGRVLNPINCAGIFELASGSDKIAHYRAYLAPIDFAQAAEQVS